MNSVVKFFHQLRNPHCPHCIEDAEELKYCISCETLKIVNAELIREKERLLDSILEARQSPSEPLVDNDKEPEPIRPRIVPWHIRKQMLENEDKQKAQLLKQASEERKQAIEDLEQRLNVNSLDLTGEENVQSSTVEGDEGTHQQKEVS